jgi:hypothetical protein
MTTSEGLTWGGIDVASFALRAKDLSGLLAIPARRGENLAVAGRDGTIRQPRKLYDGREFVVEYLIRGCLPDGTIPDGPAASTFYDNMHVLAALCVQDVAPLVHTLPDGVTQRHLDVEVLNAVEPERWLAGMNATVKVAYTSASAWWRALAPTVVDFTLADGATRVLTEFADSDGRIDDALVTFGATGNNPLLTQVETAIGIGYNATFASGDSITLGDYAWEVGGAVEFARTQLVTDPRIGTWWVLDPVPGGAPTVRLDLTGGGPMDISISARQSWAVG